MSNSLRYTTLSHAEMQASRDSIRDLALTAYSSHGPSLSAEGLATMQMNMQKDEGWTALFEHAYCFACYDTDKLIGMAFLIPSGHPWKFFEKQWAYVRMVAVHPEYANKGIARRLMHELIEKATSLFEKTLMLHTSEFMDSARHLYDRMGFTMYREIAPQFGKRYWLFELPLKRQARVVSLPELTPAHSAQIDQLWNETYPVNLKNRFHLLLDDASSYQHYLVLSPTDKVAAWAVAFQKGDETRFSIIVAPEYQGKELGTLLLNQLKANYPVFYGWVIDHNNDTLQNGQLYRSPINFYKKAGFVVLNDQRIETEIISAVKVKWSAA